MTETESVLQAVRTEPVIPVAERHDTETRCGLAQDARRFVYLSRSGRHQHRRHCLPSAGRWLSPEWHYVTDSRKAKVAGTVAHSTLAVYT